MASNLLDLIKDYFTTDVATSISKYLGVDLSGAQSAINAALPVVLGGLVSKTSDPKGANEIFDMVKGLDGSNLPDIGNILGGGPKTDDFISAGSGFVNSIFGNQTDSVNQYVAKESGLSVGSLAKFLPIIGSVVMAFLGKESKSKGLSSGVAMAGMLAGLLPTLKGLIPTGFLNSLGLSNLAGETKTAVKHTAKEVEDEARGGLGKILLPLLGIAALLALIYLFGKGCGKETTVTTVKKDTVQKVVKKDTMTSNMPREWIALGKFAIFKLISGDTINIPELGIERKLIGFITDSSKVVDKETWFSFDRILFETDKATLRPESMDQIKSIAAILKAYPNVELKIGGYTDNTGEAKHNQQLSTERANAVMNAIVGMGIPSARLKAEGYGSQYPVADNSTEEGRAKNRRIDVRVTKK